MNNKKLTYSEAIEKIMFDNGYIAPLKLLYSKIRNYKDISKIKWKTPDKTIQERVQRDPRFTKIGYWVYALTKYLDQLPEEKEVKTHQEKLEKMHSRIQGMLIEIWNMNWFETFTPDKNQVFENKQLWKITTLNEVPLFTYESIINESIRFVDVVWFNERLFPSKLIEVEN